MRNIGWLLGLTLVACAGEEEEESKPEGGNADSFITVGPTNSDRIDAANLIIEAYAAWDPENEVFVSTVEGNGVYAAPPQVVFILLDSGGQRACAVILQADEPLQPASWSNPADAVLGFEFAPGEGTVIDGCTDFVLPTEFNGDAGAAISRWTWGFALSQLADDTEEYLETVLPASEWDALEPIIVGATFYSEIVLLTGEEVPWLDYGVARGFALDDDLVLDVGGTGQFTNVNNDEIFLPGREVGRAYYTFFVSAQGSPLLLFSPGTALTLPIPEVPDFGGTGDTFTLPDDTADGPETADTSAQQTGDTAAGGDTSSNDTAPPADTSNDTGN